MIVLQHPKCKNNKNKKQETTKHHIYRLNKDNDKVFWKHVLLPYSFTASNTKDNSMRYNTNQTSQTSAIQLNVGGWKMLLFQFDGKKPSIKVRRVQFDCKVKVATVSQKNGAHAPFPVLPIRTALQPPEIIAIPLERSWVPAMLT